MRIQLATITCLSVGILALQEAGATPVTFFGEDINVIPFANNTTDHPNTIAARDLFIAALPGSGTENLESFDVGSAPPLTLDFNGLAAQLTEAGGVQPGSIDENILSSPTATSKVWSMIDGTSTIDFGGASQTAVGFLAFDAGDSGSQITVTLHQVSGGTTVIDVPHQLRVSAEGGTLYFGVLDESNPFDQVSIQNTGVLVDGFQLDDITIVPEPSTSLLIGFGLLALGIGRRRR